MGKFTRVQFTVRMLRMGIKFLCQLNKRETVGNAQIANCPITNSNFIRTLFASQNFCFQTDRNIKTNFILHFIIIVTYLIYFMYLFQVDVKLQ